MDSWVSIVTSVPNGKADDEIDDNPQRQRQAGIDVGGLGLKQLIDTVGLGGARFSWQLRHVGRYIDDVCLRKRGSDACYDQG